MDLFNIALTLFLAAVAVGLVADIVRIVRMVRRGQATHYVITLKSGVSQPYDYAQTVTRAEQPSLYKRALRREIVGLLALVLFLALTLKSSVLDPDFRAWIGALF
jgi:hypothetical protein